ncbi:hypothetical protein EV196_102423 [Mariniflexile fucanivorans]|uniref:Lipoprotein n=1 Tax=Mariniflexile fucanivorans TaxID=264023 RepID=A0A4R1RPI8_9FLAO|nr:hypothetical protein [Mariniflexile fucanivorans]TCL67860.1 hypothetical protein EV196_102423 [Mariniflexile fucanivorans]
MKWFEHLLFIIVFLVVTNCNMPKDPNKSWNSIKQHEMQVGVVQAPVDSERFKLIEQEKIMMEKFGTFYKVKSKFLEGTETQLIDSLNNNKIHLIIGGFEKNNILKNEVGTTAPYDGIHVLFIPKGENLLLFKLEEFIYKIK